MKKNFLILRNLNIFFVLFLIFCYSRLDDNNSFRNIEFTLFIYIEVMIIHFYVKN